MAREIFDPCCLSCGMQTLSCAMQTFFFFFQNYVFIYLAVLGLSHGTRDICSSLQHVGSLVGAYELLVTVCII